MTELVRLLCGQCPADNRHVMARVIDDPGGPRLVARLRRADMPPFPGVVVSNIRDDFDVPVAELGSPYNRTVQITVGCKRHGWGTVSPELIREWTEQAISTRATVLEILTPIPEP